MGAVPSISDWAAKAAERVDDEYRGERTSAKRARYPSVDRIAAIIATFAEPLMKALRESKREHYHCDDCYYCCGLCMEHCMNEGPEHEHDISCSIAIEKVCTCGADDWNARVDAVLAGEPIADTFLDDFSRDISGLGPDWTPVGHAEDGVFVSNVIANGKQVKRVSVRARKKP